MNSTMNITTRNKITRSLSIVLFSVLALSACGQKGPLILKKKPVDATQAPLENSNDVVPVETSDERSESETKSEGE